MQLIRFFPSVAVVTAFFALLLLDHQSAAIWIERFSHDVGFNDLPNTAMDLAKGYMQSSKNLPIQIEMQNNILKRFNPALTKFVDQRSRYSRVRYSSASNDEWKDVAIIKDVKQNVGAFDITNYGAVCDGVVDDAPAFNRALTAIRRSKDTDHYPIGRAGTLKAPSRICMIKSTINMTGLYGSGFVADLWGTVLKCETDGTPCVDATGTGQASLLGLNIWADGTKLPNIGLMVGRITNDGIGADHLYIDHSTISGAFSLAPYFNNQSETTLVEHAEWVNFAPNAWGAIWDGANHFNIQSAFTGKIYPKDTPMSFNENTCVECYIGTYGAGDSIAWIGATTRHKFINGYAFYSNSIAGNPGNGFDLDFTSASTDVLDLDVHIEDFGGKGNLKNEILFTGAANPVVHGLRMRDSYLEQNGPIFARGFGVSTVTIQDADLHVGVLYNTNATWWDLATAYTVAGTIYSQDSSYVAVGRFSGMLCMATACNSTVVLPSHIIASEISNTGGVSGIALISAGSYLPGSTAPSCAIDPPASGGQQATCAVTGLAVLGFGDVGASSNDGDAGSGYAIGDLVYPVGGRCSTVPSIRVNSIGKGGSISGFQFHSGGLCSHAPPWDFKKQTTTTTNGSGKDFTLYNASYKVAGVDVTAAGSNYPTIPRVMFSGTAVPAMGTVKLSGNMTVVAGEGRVVLDAIGTRIGTAGVAGGPVRIDGALIKTATGSSRPSNGDTIIIENNTDSYGILGSSGLSTLTIRLPVLTGVIGQEILIDFVPSIEVLNLQDSFGRVLAITSVNATAPKRLKSFDGLTWTMVQ